MTHWVSSPLPSDVPDLPTANCLLKMKYSYREYGDSRIHIVFKKPVRSHKDIIPALGRQRHASTYLHTHGQVHAVTNVHTQNHVIN